MDPMSDLSADDMMMIRIDEASAGRDETRRADVEADLGLFACPACGKRIRDGEKLSCAWCRKVICASCARTDRDGEVYCSPDCQIGVYREIIANTKRMARDAEDEYGRRIRELEAG